MEQEKKMTNEESLELITRMISKAKNDYRDTGLTALFWGSIITFCALVTFFNYYLQWPFLRHIWFLALAAVIPQVILSKTERKAKKFKQHHDDLIGGIWISYVIAIFFLTYMDFVIDIPNINSIFLILYGIPTFATGYGRGFKPMIIGGIACWVFSLLSLYTPFPYTMLYNAVAAQLAWFIPGLILRKRYLKAKEQHV